MGFIRKVGSNTFNFSKNKVSEIRHKNRNAKYAENFRKAYNVKKTHQEKLVEQEDKRLRKFQEKHHIIGRLIRARKKIARRHKEPKALPTHGTKKRFNRYF